MFHIVAEKIAAFMIKHRWLTQEKHEIYEYAIEAILLNGGLLFINLLISLAIGKISFFIAFLLVFAPIRAYLGGLHLKSAELCMVCSVAFYTAAMFANEVLYQRFGQIEVGILVVFYVFGICLKPLKEKLSSQKEKNKKIANGIMTVDLIVILWCIYKKYKIVSAFVLLDICAVLFFLVAKLRFCLKGYKK